MEARQTKAILNHVDRRRTSRNKRLLLPHMPIQFDQQESLQRQDVEQFIAERFDYHYQAKISHFLPCLLSTKTGDKFTAAMGFQPANDASLFLEQYLSTSIESEIERITGQIVNRNTIAEVGNLTSAHRVTSQLLFVLTTAILHEAGFKWSVFTATKHVQQLLRRLDLITITVCEADPALLQDNIQSWGSYYNDKPNVIIGNLTDAIVLLKQHPVTGFILQNYQQMIMNIASKIKR